MGPPKEPTAFYKWINYIWEWISRPLLKCDGNSCGGYIDPQLLFEQDDEGLIPIIARHPNDGWETLIYIYYCPWCGRRLSYNKSLVRTTDASLPEENNEYK